MVIANFFICSFSNFTNAQILSTTPNEYFTPATFGAFQMPTSTDVVLSNGHPLQVIAATTPMPTLYWDDNNGHKSQINIAGFASTSKVLLDDIALAKDNSGNIFAYITVRVLRNDNFTEIHLFGYRWDVSIHSFLILPAPTFISVRPTGNDLLDGVRLDINLYNFPPDYVFGQFNMVWQENGNILMNQGVVNFVNGTINYSSTIGGVLNSIVLSGGNYSNPDVLATNTFRCTDPLCATWEYRPMVVAIYKDALIERIHKSIGINNTIFYSVSSPQYKLRIPRLLRFGSYFDVIINELDLINKKSIIKIVTHDGTNITPFPTNMNVKVNEDAENYCTNNNNFLLTGFPNYSIKALAFGGTGIEIVWQQVICSSSDFCNIQAVTKRYTYDIAHNVIGQSFNFIPDYFPTTQYFYLNNDLSKNSVFPSISHISGDGFQNFYSFGTMDKNTSLNGQIAYKKSAFNSTSLKAFESLNNKEEVITKMSLERLKVFPNPADNELNIVNDKIIATIEAFNLTGVLMKKINVNNNLRATLNTSKWPSGQYVLKIYNKDGSFRIEKIIVNH